MDPLDWQDRAVCKGQTKLFFGPPGERPDARVVREMRAGELCAQCPVRAECRDDARARREPFFRGGESEQDRAAAGYAPVNAYERLLSPSTAARMRRKQRAAQRERDRARLAEPPEPESAEMFCGRHPQWAEGEVA